MFKGIIKEAIDEVMNYLKNIVNVESSYHFGDMKSINVINSLSRLINHILRKFDLHITRWSYFENLRASNSLSSPRVKLAALELLYEISEDHLSEVYNMLEDDFSRTTFKWFIKYRVAFAFFSHGIACKLFPPPTFSSISDFEKFSRKCSRNSGGYLIGDLVIEAPLRSLYNIFIEEQYKYFEKVDVKNGDVVLDIGAFAGDSVLYFSKKVGEKGRVYAFEPNPHNTRLLEANLRKNNIKNVTIVKKAVSNYQNIVELLDSDAVSSMSSIKEKRDRSNNSSLVESITIDYFVEQRKIQRVDFIKMDIEGEELNALIGAKDTIRRFKPKLAISVYHKGQDIVEIPRYIKSIMPDYKLFLKQGDPFCNSELVLFAG